MFRAIAGLFTLVPAFAAAGLPCLDNALTSIEADRFGAVEMRGLSACLQSIRQERNGVILTALDDADAKFHDVESLPNPDAASLATLRTSLAHLEESLAQAGQSANDSARRESLKLAAVAEHIAAAQQESGLAGAAAVTTGIFGENDQRLHELPAISNAGLTKGSRLAAEPMDAFQKAGVAWLGKNEKPLRKVYDNEFKKREQTRIRSGETPQKAYDAVFAEISPLGPSVLLWEFEDDFLGASVEGKRGLLQRLCRLLALPGVPPGRERDILLKMCHQQGLGSL